VFGELRMMMTSRVGKPTNGKKKGKQTYDKAIN